MNAKPPTPQPRNPIGLDVGGTNLRAAVWDGQQVRHLARRPTPASVDGLVAAIDETCRQAERHVTPDALGIGVPGAVDATTAEWIPNLPFLDGVDLARLSPLPTKVHNDANLALLGEAWHGAAQNVDDVILITVGTGIGGAIMAGGRILKGAHRTAGAFGWMMLDLDDPGNPNHGHLERIASGTALEHRAHRQSLTAEQLVGRARNGAPAALDAVVAIARPLGAAVASAVSILDPSIVLIGGGLSDTFDLLHPPIETALQRWASPACRSTPVLAAQLGDHAGVVGAVRCTLVDQEVWL